LFQDDIPIRETHYSPMSGECLPGVATNMLMSVCRNFTEGLALGKFCHDMCDGVSMHIERCYRQGRTYVMLVRLKERRLVMKVKERRPVEPVVRTLQDMPGWDSSHNDYKNAFKTLIERNLGQDTGRLFHDYFASIFRHLFGKSTDKMTKTEMVSSWDVFGQDEIVLSLLHPNIPSLPEILGVCGPLYFVEKTRAYSELFPEIIPSISWKDRVHIAKSFLDLAVDLRRSGLHHCDIKEANMGLSEVNDVVAIHTDLVYSRDRLRGVMMERVCSSDEQCRLFDCITQCDRKSNKCTNRTLSNNLQVICRDIFYPAWPRTGLLTYFQPVHISTHLNRLLRNCRSKRFGTVGESEVSSMVQQVHSLLDVSLQTPL